MVLTILVAIFLILSLGTIVWIQSLQHTKIEKIQQEDEQKYKPFRKEIRKYAIGWAVVAVFTIFIIGNTLEYGRVKAKEVEVEQNDSLQASPKRLEYCVNRIGALDKTKLLIEAIGYVESRNDPSCQGGGELQITKVCVDAANKFQNKVHYEYADRYSLEKSIEIWHIIQNNCNKTGDIEKAIRLWNGGPGYTIAGTQEYYERVMRRYNYLVDNELDKICRHYKSLSLK